MPVVLEGHKDAFGLHVGKSGSCAPAAAQHARGAHLLAPPGAGNAAPSGGVCAQHRQVLACLPPSWPLPVLSVPAHAVLGLQSADTASMKSFVRSISTPMSRRYLLLRKGGYSLLVGHLPGQLLLHPSGILHRFGSCLLVQRLLALLCPGRPPRMHIGSVPVSASNSLSSSAWLC